MSSGSHQSRSISTQAVVGMNPFLAQAPSVASGAAAGTGGGKNRRVRFFVGFGGRVREWLLATGPSAGGETDIDRWLDRAAGHMQRKSQLGRSLRFNYLDFLSAELETGYELVANEWLVQHASDLNVFSETISSGPNGSVFLGVEVKSALERVFSPAGANFSVLFDRFLREFDDLDLNPSLLGGLWDRAVRRAAAATGGGAPGADQAVKDRLPPSSAQTVKDRLPPSANLPDALWTCLFGSSLVLRAMTRARLFSGIIWAGGGTSGIAYKNTTHTPKTLEDVTSFSIPLGNRSPYMGFTTQESCGNNSALWPKTPGGFPITHESVAIWRAAIKTHLQESHHLQEKENPPTLRGFFVGFSAVFYAAKHCRCAERILSKPEFVSILGEKAEALLAKHRANFESEDDVKLLSNLVLVHTLVDFLLHESAWIVCKRNWKGRQSSWSSDSTEQDHEEELNVDENEEQQRPDQQLSVLPDYVAHWGLGFYLASLRAGGGERGPSWGGGPAGPVAEGAGTEADGGGQNYGDVVGNGEQKLATVAEQGPVLLVSDVASLSTASGTASRTLSATAD